MPPPYHFVSILVSYLDSTTSYRAFFSNFFPQLFLLISSFSSFVIIFMCAAEIEVLTTIEGIVFDLSGNFMDITFGSLVNAILDLIAISGMAKQGYEKMAFAATFAGPFFSKYSNPGVLPTTIIIKIRRSIC